MKTRFAQVLTTKYPHSGVWFDPTDNLRKTDPETNLEKILQCKLPPKHLCSQPDPVTGSENKSHCEGMQKGKFGCTSSARAKQREKMRWEGKDLFRKVLTGGCGNVQPSSAPSLAPIAISGTVGASCPASGASAASPKS